MVDSGAVQGNPGPKKLRQSRVKPILVFPTHSFFIEIAFDQRGGEFSDQEVLKKELSSLHGEMKL